MHMPASNLASAPSAVVLASGRTSVATRRLIGTAVAICSAGLLALAAYLQPSATGLGTHAQLTRVQCGWIVLMDTPCPTCGMTTAFAHAADGHLLAALAAQPLGALLAVATAMALLIGVYVAATGSRVGAMFGRLWGPRAAWVLGGLVVSAWIYKIIIYKGLLQ